MSTFRLKSQKLELSENDVEEQCRTFLGLRGYKVLRLHVGRFKTAYGSFVTIGEPGMPDYVATHGKYPAFYLEVKRPGASRSPDQMRKHVELHIQGQHVVTISQVTDLHAWLERYESSP